MIDLKYKSQKTYSPIDSNWNCFWHKLSGDELKQQIISLFYKPTNQENSWSFDDVSVPYKMYDDDGLSMWLKEKYGDLPENDITECVEYIFEFLDDAKIEYTGKPFRK